MNESLVNYFNGDELAAKVWLNKYALKNSDEVLLEHHPDEMHQRLALEFARIENKYPNPLTYNEIYDVIKNFKYIIPQGSPMAGIGNNHQVVSISNCFVVGNENDSYGGIYRTDEEQVQLAKRRGGVGHDLSYIRPKGSIVKNSALTSTGVVPFMEEYSNSMRTVAQDGRRGALMLSIMINHPDVESFIDAKLEQGKVTGANISVKITDEFMKAVENDSDFVLRFPCNLDFSLDGVDYEYNKLYETKNSEVKYYKVIKAKELWNKIVKNAHKSAEPGILFWDNIINESLPDCYADKGFKTVSTNPCGEIPLCIHDSCRLLSINLYSYVKNPFESPTYSEFDFTLFKKHVRIAQRLMDDIVDLELEKIDQILSKIESDPEPEDIKYVEKNLWLKIKEKCINGRRTGLGITAEGDMLAALGYRYGTKEASKFSEYIHTTLAIESYTASIELAKERGSFPIWNKESEKNNPFLNRILKFLSKDVISDYDNHGRRNIANLTIAPTGSTSMLSQTTSGIEPLFLPFYTRRVKINKENSNSRIDFTDVNGDNWQEFLVIHEKLGVWYNVSGKYLFQSHLESGEIDKIPELKELTLKDWEFLFPFSPYYKATSNDVDWLEKVRMQGLIQKWVDHSISVTINLPSDATQELVGKLYLEAWKNKCKGSTIYVDGSRAGVLISANQSKEIKIEFDKRPKVLQSTLEIVKIKGRNYAIIIGYKNDKPYELFTFSDPVGISGKITGFTTKEDTGVYSFDSTNYKITNIVEETRATEEGIIGLITSFGLRHNNITPNSIPIQHVIKLIKKCYPGFGNLTTSVSVTLKEFIEDGQTDGEKCPECSQKLIFEDGCRKCNNCGHSACG